MMTAKVYHSKPYRSEWRLTVAAKVISYHAELRQRPIWPRYAPGELSNETAALHLLFCTTGTARYNARGLLGSVLGRIDRAT